MTREEIIIRNPLDREMERRGWPVKGRGQKLESTHCPGKEHSAGHLCMNIDLGKGLWKCHACDTGGSIIDFIMAADGLTMPDAMKMLGGEQTPTPPPRPQTPPRQSGGPGQIVKTYDYTDAAGNLLYQVCRLEPKSFRQRHRDVAGNWSWSMEGVQRVLYNLPAIAKADFVWLVEGEKDADALSALKLCATCNVGGAGKWEESYSETLRGKDVILCGDNDEPGQKHVTKVREALSKVAKSIRIIAVPAAHKDVSDWLATLPDSTARGAALLALAEAAEVLVAGQRLPLKSMVELEREYSEFTRTANMMCLRFCDWLPSTLHHIRPIVPGEVVVFIAGTGVGKTMLLQNLALHTRLTTLLFEMELPGSLSFERFAAMATETPGSQVFDAYYRREPVAWRETNKLDHIHVCSESRMTVVELERIIRSAGLKIGMAPGVVMVDYVQLIQGKGDRYERISDAMEGLKIIAKATNTIIVLASQIGRQKGDDNGGEVFLCDAKESGSIENSAGLVLGAWRDAEDKRLMWLKVMKNTKGISGKRIACRIGEGLTISEAEAAIQLRE